MRYFTLLFLLTLSLSALSQEKCGTSQFNQSTVAQSSEQSKARFENWLKAEMFQKQEFSRQQDGQSETVYEIPVVVHVVHKGESVGDITNIPFEQIKNQIDSLNNDFRRLNHDKSDTPGSFAADAADVKIEFVLASRDPEGLPTDGIVRVVGNQSSFTINEAIDLAANSYWPAEEYLNIWVADLSNGLLGFAKFPISNEPGMDEDPNLNRLIDGVFLDYEYFGTGLNADDFSRGRTLTHEVGHWLGLRHIWGDGGCGVDDFCTDTPTQGSSSSGCPSVSQESCSSVDMFQNFMDYTDDVCMNLFTNCQSDRMRTVLENSPRRKELLTSKGGEAVIQVANDLGIKSIQSPKFGNCNLLLSPEVEVRNYGTNTISSFSVDLMVDEVVIETQSITENLDVLQTLFVSFAPLSVSQDVQEVSFKVNKVNGGVDGNTANDCKWVSTFFPAVQSIPFNEDFTAAMSTENDNWQLEKGSTSSISWSYVTAPNLLADNEAVALSYFEAPVESFGTLDYLISPVFDLSGLVTADIKFKYAYSGYPDNFSDALTVVVSTDCGATFPEENILFQKIGAELSTTTTTASSFVPTDAGDWLEVEKNFGQFAGSSQVVIAFIGSNGGGNNIYVDDIDIFSSAANDYDVGILHVNQLPIVTCESQVDMEIIIKNYGKETITNMDVSYAYQNTNPVFQVDDISLTPGKEEKVTLSANNLAEGDYQLTIAVSDPNGMQDEDETNNSETHYFRVDSTVESVPLRERFSKSLESSDWNFVRTDAPSDWSISEFREENSSDFALTFKGHEVLPLGIENWLVSPVLDFSDLEEASCRFEVSYANRIGRNDELKVLASNNCGRTYDQELYSKKGGELAVKQSETAWVPEEDTDWRKEFIDLTAFAGDSEVRLAFVITNQNGNNIYLDNIEFFVSAEENPIEITESMRIFPSPATDHLEVKFNFNIKEEVLIRLVGLNGEVVAEQTFPNTLNQIYRMDGLQVSNSGLYILQVLGNFTNLSSKVLILQ